MYKICTVQNQTPSQLLLLLLLLSCYFYALRTIKLALFSIRHHKRCKIAFSDLLKLFLRAKMFFFILACTMYLCIYTFFLLYTVFLPQQKVILPVGLFKCAFCFKLVLSFFSPLSCVKRVFIERSLQRLQVYR